MSEHYTLDEVRSWLAMWRRMKHLYDAGEYDQAVSEYGADMVACMNIADIEQAISGCLAELGEA